MSEISHGTSQEQREFWRMVFESHHGSGLTVKRFCQKKGFSESMFYYWRKKLGPSDCGTGAGESIRPTEEIAGSVPGAAERAISRGEEFIELSLPAARPGGATGQLRFAGGCVLQFDTGISRGSLMTILSSLRELGLC
jgi:hypothetical protein